MMGEPVGRQDRLFYEFDLEDMVPGDHLLRRIDAALDLSWLRAEMQAGIVTLTGASHSLASSDPSSGRHAHALPSVERYGSKLFACLSG